MKVYLLPPDGTFYKANLHCHSKEYDNSAGFTAMEIKELYKSHGYNIIAFTEHDKLTYNEDLNDDSFIALPGFEMGMSDPETDKIYHFNCFPKHYGIKENYSYSNFKFSLENVNKMIKTQIENDYLVVYNHPVCSFHEPEEFLKFEGIFALEIYNNVVESINLMGWSNVYYEMMLRKGYKIWAIAADDNHICYQEPVYTPPSTPYNDCMGGFVMIKAKELKHASIINALEKGEFYSCVGTNGQAPQIHNMYIEDNIFYADFSPVKSVYLKNSCWHCPHKLSYNDDITYVAFEIDKTWKYMRLEIMDTKGHRTLGNPYFLT